MKTEPSESSGSLKMPERSQQLIRRKPTSGYVLLCVIATAVLVITCLSMLAVQSLKMGLRAADEERMLQKRWGSRSMQQVLLANAERVFQQREEQTRLSSGNSPIPAVLRSQLVLGNVTFDMLLADEDAKLPLNTLYHHAGRKKTEEWIRRSSGPNVQIATRLNPAVPPLRLDRERAGTRMIDDIDEETELDLPDAFRSWGEVFDLTTLNRFTGAPLALETNTTDLTCWGSGQLNFRRASDDAILAMTSTVVQDGKARRILQRYRSSPTATLSTLLQSEISDEQERVRLQSMLSETSTNFSISIDARSPTGPSLRTFTVMKRDAEGVSQKQRFSY